MRISLGVSGIIVDSGFCDIICEAVTLLPIFALLYTLSGWFMYFTLRDFWGIAFCCDNTSSHCKNISHNFFETLDVLFLFLKSGWTAYDCNISFSLLASDIVSSIMVFIGSDER